MNPINYTGQIILGIMSLPIFICCVAVAVINFFNLRGAAEYKKDREDNVAIALLLATIPYLFMGI